MPFSFANVVVLPLVLGIGVDAGVHMVHRNRQSQDSEGVGQLDETVRTTGGAVLIASVTTLIGFAGLTLADYVAMKSLGITMVIGVSSSLIASLWVLPAVLYASGRAR